MVQATAEVPKGTYPEMMKLPPSFPFYPRHLLRYEGVGPVSARRVIYKILATIGVAIVASTGIRYAMAARTPPPKTLTAEWRKAAEERSKKLNADPISKHKIGQPVADPWEVNRNIRDANKRPE